MSDEARALWEWAIRRDRWLWHTGEPCKHCGEWVGHFGGSATVDPCRMIPKDVPLEEVRENRYRVRRSTIGDAIRAACDRHSAPTSAGPGFNES